MARIDASITFNYHKLEIEMEFQPKIIRPGVVPDIKDYFEMIRPKRSLSVDRLIKDLAYHSYTIFLFIRSDFKTIIIPSTIFGVSNSFATSAYGLGDTAPLSMHLLAIRFLRTFLWVSLALIPFVINNQRTPSAIIEDASNKPWRPMPQKRLTPATANYVRISFLMIVQAHGLICHGIGHRQSTLLLALDIWYNNFGGANDDPIIRNGLNSLGYLCFISGALEVALWEKLPFALQSLLGETGTRLYLPQWLFIVACIILSTVHVQDLFDQEGDSILDRRTIPLVIGDEAARWTIAIPMPLWGIICPYFWNVRLEILLMSLGLAYTIALRVLAFRTVENDRATYRLWNFWIATIFAMPLLSRQD